MRNLSWHVHFMLLDKYVWNFLRKVVNITNNFLYLQKKTFISNQFKHFDSIRPICSCSGPTVFMWEPTGIDNLWEKNTKLSTKVLNIFWMTFLSKLMPYRIQFSESRTTGEWIYLPLLRKMCCPQQNSKHILKWYFFPKFPCILFATGVFKLVCMWKVLHPRLVLKQAKVTWKWLIWLSSSF